MNELEKLSELVKNRNSIEKEISQIIQRPAFTGHLGEYIASKIFDVELNDSATQKGHDGIFKSGSLQGKSVNVKLYSKRENLLDVSLDYPPDHYLVLSGPKYFETNSKNTVRPLILASVFLFNSKTFLEQSKQRGIKISKQISAVESQWNDAEIFPVQRNKDLILSDEQKNQLSLFLGGNTSNNSSTFRYFKESLPISLLMAFISPLKL